jgi:hypothetical protein
MSDGVWWPEFEQWLLAHGIDCDRERVAEVAWRPPSAGAGDRPQCLEVTTFRLRDGHPYKAVDGDVATETRVVPMLHLPAVEVVRYR